MMISDDMVAQYQRDGAVCIRQLFRPPEIEELRAGIELNLAVPSPRAKIANSANDTAILAVTAMKAGRVGTAGQPRLFLNRA